MPVHLIALGNGQIAFQRTQQFPLIYERCEGYEVVLDEEGIMFSENILDSELLIPYNVSINWRDKPVLIEWLQSMNLQMPQFI